MRGSTVEGAALEEQFTVFQAAGCDGILHYISREGTLHSKTQGSLKLAYKLPHLLYTNDAFTQLLQSDRAKSLVF